MYRLHIYFLHFGKKHHFGVVCTISQKWPPLSNVCPVSNLSMSQMAKSQTVAPAPKNGTSITETKCLSFPGEKDWNQKKTSACGEAVGKHGLQALFFLIYKQNILYELLSRLMQSWTLDRWWKNFGSLTPQGPQDAIETFLGSGYNPNLNQPTPLPRDDCIPGAPEGGRSNLYLHSLQDQLSLIFKAATGIEQLALPSWRKVIRVKISSKTPLQLIWNLKMMEVYGKWCSFSKGWFSGEPC